MYSGNDVFVVVRGSGLSCEASEWVGLDELHSMSVDNVNGHSVDEMRAIWLFPDRYDD